MPVSGFELQQRLRPTPRLLHRTALMVKTVPDLFAQRSARTGHQHTPGGRGYDCGNNHVAISCRRVKKEISRRLEKSIAGKFFSVSGRVRKQEISAAKPRSPTRPQTT